jgi:hypothetical protein
MGTVDYTVCPQCGTDLSSLLRSLTDCSLCGAPENAQAKLERKQVSIEQPDLDARLAD